MIETFDNLSHLILNLVPLFTTISLIIFGGNIYFKYNKNENTKYLFSLLIDSLLLMLTLNSLYLILSKHIYFEVSNSKIEILKKFILSQNNYWFIFILALLALIFNVAIIIEFGKILHNRLNKKNINNKQVILHLLMPFFSALFFWWVTLIFTTEKWDTAILFENTSGTVFAIVLFIISLGIPGLNILFTIGKYDILIYTAHNKLPFRLEAKNTEIIENGDYYYINCYNEESKKIINQIILPISEVICINKKYSNKNQ